MKVGIVGSQYWNNYKKFKQYLTALRGAIPFDMIISGGAIGVDTMAYQYAVEQGITFVCHPPHPDEPIPQRFHRRNLRIVEASEVIIAFPIRSSRGTRHTISLAKKLNKELYVIEVKE